MKEYSELLNLVDDLRISLVPEDAIRLVYLLKAWQTLSEDNKISNEDLTFDAFYNSKITVGRLKDILGKLAKEHYLFSLPSPLSNTGVKIKDEALVKLLNIIRDSTSFISVGEMFYSLLSKGRGYFTSTQVVELGVKLLGTGCTEIYSPFSRNQNLVYFTDAKVYAEALTDEFVIELMKVIEHKDIEFYYTDPLESPSYVNPEAPHLLRQFECTLSFPPMGLREKNDFYNHDTYNRFKVYRGRGSRDVPNFEHILAQTKKKAVVLMPVGFSYRAGVELEFRQYLVENNLLEAVVQLPPNLHSATSIETTFLIVNKQKTDRTIQFINLNQDRFLQKGKRRIMLNDLDEIATIYLEKDEIENVSKIASNEEVAENNYSLSVDRYVISQEATKLKTLLSSYALLKLQDIAVIRRSQMFRDEEEGLEVVELSPSDVALAGYTNTSSKRKRIGSQESRLRTYALQPNDILLSTKGTIGKVAIVGESDKPMIASQAMLVIRLAEDAPIDPIVLYMYLKSDIGQALLKQLVSGAAMPQIATQEIKEFQVPFLSVDSAARIIENFHEEIKLYEEIEEKRQKINQIHHQFLGEEQ